MSMCQISLAPNLKEDKLSFVKAVNIQGLLLTEKNIYIHIGKVLKLSQTPGTLNTTAGTLLEVDKKRKNKKFK